MSCPRTALGAVMGRCRGADKLRIAIGASVLQRGIPLGPAGVGRRFGIDPVLPPSARQQIWCRYIQATPLVIATPNNSRNSSNRYALVQATAGVGTVLSGAYRGEGGFAVGLFRRGIFCISNSCEISHIIIRPLCEINPLRNLAKYLVQQLPEHKSVVPFHKS